MKDSGRHHILRTQISLDKDEYDLAEIQAASLGISIAEFIRRAVRERLPIRGEGVWMKYAGFVETGDPHSSQGIDGLILWDEGLGLTDADLAIVG